MYAMIGKLTAQPAARDKLVGILVRASKIVTQMSGCQTYVVSEDIGDESCVWVFETWDDKEAHDTSLKDEQVRSLIAKAVPFMSGAPVGAELRIMGG